MVWDTAGQEQYLSITKSYFRNIDAVVLVYSVNNRESFEKIKIINDINRNKKNTFIFLFLMPVRIFDFKFFIILV